VTKLADPIGVGAAGGAHVNSTADFEDIASVERAGFGDRHFLEAEPSAAEAAVIASPRRLAAPARQTTTRSSKTTRASSMKTPSG
jgi:hypothetical protein